MNKKIELTLEFVKNKLQKESSGHDFWHVYRVWKNAIKIAQTEKADMFVVQLVALLHDIADWKFFDGDLTIGSKIASDFLSQLDIDKVIIEHVCEIIQKISFKGAKTKSEKLSIEGQIVQDADRLDALGAIGIARTFAYGGFTKREIYDPNILPILHENFDQYKKNKSPSLNHFYEKLLLLKDMMNTQYAKKIAEERDLFMHQFLKRFFEEIEEKPFKFNHL